MARGSSSLLSGDTKLRGTPLAPPGAAMAHSPSCGPRPGGGGEGGTEGEGGVREGKVGQAGSTAADGNPLAAAPRRCRSRFSPGTTRNTRSGAPVGTTTHAGHTKRGSQHRGGQTRGAQSFAAGVERRGEEGMQRKKRKEKSMQAALGRRRRRHGGRGRRNAEGERQVGAGEARAEEVRAGRG